MLWFHIKRLNNPNRLADGLVNYAFLLPLTFHLLDTRPYFISSIVLDDANGSTKPRHVRLYYDIFSLIK